MIGTAIITDINKTIGVNEQNAFELELAIFSQPGDTEEDLRDKRVLATASICIGARDMYEVGDAVYVGFVNGTFNQPIILGKIYKGVNEPSRGCLYSQGIEATDHATLPINTVIGDITGKMLQEALRTIDTLKSRVEELEKKVNP